MKIEIFNKLKELKYLKNKIYSQNMDSGDMIFLMHQSKTGNFKVLRNLEWIRHIESIYYNYYDLLINEQNIDLDFSLCGNIPYSIYDIYNDMKKIKVKKSLLIVEFLYDAKGKDSDKEWIVLYNQTDDDINLLDYRIQIAGSKFKTIYELNKEILKTHEYIIIKGSLKMYNGGQRADGLRILDDKNNIIDTVLYGENNFYNLNGDNNNKMLAKDVHEGYSLKRIFENNNYIDSDNSSIDFIENKNPNLKKYGDYIIKM